MTWHPRSFRGPRHVPSRSWSSQFAVWNCLASTVFLLSVGPAACGAGKVASGHDTDPVSVGRLVAASAVAAVYVMLALLCRRVVAGDGRGVPDLVQAITAYWHSQQNCA